MIPVDVSEALDLLLGLDASHKGAVETVAGLRCPAT